METARTESLAAQILQAEDSHTPFPVPSASGEGLTREDGYGVQFAYVALRLKRGERVVGKKIGATSQAIQQSMNLREPVFGFNFAQPAFSQSEPIALNRLIHPKVEMELAFVLKRRLAGPGVTLSDVLRATEGVMPAFEIADCRFDSWRMPAADILADNSHASGIVLGARLTSLKNLDLRCTGAILERNGELLATATTAAALGNPALAVVWLANALARYAQAIEAGEVILTGSLTLVYDAHAGDAFNATFAGLGSVSARFE
jgi:2-keto-4-pentenoate hydratase